jgi:hypothetical protein
MILGQQFSHYNLWILFLFRGCLGGPPRSYLLKDIPAQPNFLKHFHTTDTTLHFILLYLILTTSKIFQLKFVDLHICILCNITWHLFP